MLLGWVLYRRIGMRIRVAGMAISYLGVVLVFGHEIRLEGGQAAWGAAAGLSPARSATPSTWSTAASWCKRWARCVWWGWPPAVACLCCMAQFLLLRPLSAALWWRRR
jgi:hypothetical protein